MIEEEFKELIDKKKYQVFLFSTSLPIPFTFAVHTWIVTSNKGNIKRWEVWHTKKHVPKSYGFLNLNMRKPSVGGRKFIFGKERRHLFSKLVHSISGGENSVAQKMVEFIENDIYNYEFLNSYHYFPGPNSNTFIQWIVSKFPESGFKLPRNAVGKNFKLNVNKKKK